MSNTVTPRRLHGFLGFVGVVLGLLIGALSAMQLFKMTMLAIPLFAGTYILSFIICALTAKKPTSLHTMFMLTVGIICPVYIILLLIGVGTLGTHFAPAEPGNIEDTVKRKRGGNEPERNGKSSGSESAEEHEPTLFEIILDPNNDSPVEIYNSEGETFVFDQVAYIPYNDKQYVLLTPKVPIEGIGENQAVTFEMRYVDGDERIFFVEDKEIVDAVFSEYEKLFDENNSGGAV